MKSKVLTMCMLVIVMAIGTSTTQAQFTVLHEFTGNPSNGAKPLYGPLVLDGDYLYGMTEEGGSAFSSGVGTAFRIRTDGTGYEQLHDFQGGPSDGGYPKGQLTLYGDKLYGMTNSGGDNGSGGWANGTIFSMNRDGSGFVLLHIFNGGATDGSRPYTEVAAGQDGGIDYLYGMTKSGGTYGKGVVFSIQTNGTNYTHLRNFNGGTDVGDDPDDGLSPWGSVTLHDGKLYGMTSSGGDDSRGVVFRMNTDGSGFETLHEFGGSPDGQLPLGRPIIYNSQLYGMCVNGGNVDPAYGIVFRCNLDGSSYQVIHHFAGDPDDGRSPHGHLIEKGGLLYGMSLWGGEFGRGDVFSIDPVSGNYTNIHSFTAWDSPEGSDPYGSLVADGNDLYGMTSIGGTDGFGVVFKIGPSPCDFVDPVGVDFFDFAVLAAAWLSGEGDGNWNETCNLAEPDDVIDMADLAVCVENWLADK